MTRRLIATCLAVLAVLGAAGASPAATSGVAAAG